VPSWPWTFATLPAGNVAASKLDDNFNAAMFSAGSSTNGAVPTWNGTTGAQLNTGGLVVGTGANNIPQLDGSGFLPTSVIPTSVSALASCYATVSGGVVTLAKSSNITSITKSGAGQFVVTMTSAASDTDYRVHVTPNFGAANIVTGTEDSTVQARSTTQFGLSFWQTTINHVDPNAFSLTVFA
jgi:hypothetical protein